MTDPRDPVTPLTKADGIAAIIATLTADAEREVCRDCYGGPVRNGHRPEDHGRVVALDDAIGAVRIAATLDAARQPVTETALREAYIDALVTAWGQAHSVSAGETRNPTAIVSNIEERFKAFIPDWREAGTEAARRAPAAATRDPEPSPAAIDRERLREELWQELRFVKGATDEVVDRVASRLSVLHSKDVPQTEEPA